MYDEYDVNNKTTTLLKNPYTCIVLFLLNLCSLG